MLSASAGHRFCRPVSLYNSFDWILSLWLAALRCAVQQSIAGCDHRRMAGSFIQHLLVTWLCIVSGKQIDGELYAGVYL